MYMGSDGGHPVLLGVHGQCLTLPTLIPISQLLGRLLGSVAAPTLAAGQTQGLSAPA